MMQTVAVRSRRNVRGAKTNVRDVWPRGLSFGRFGSQGPPVGCLALLNRIYTNGKLSLDPTSLCSITRSTRRMDCGLQGGSMQHVVHPSLASLVLPRRPLYRIAKRLLDIVVSAIVLVILAPVFLACAVAV